MTAGANRVMMAPMKTSIFVGTALALLSLSSLSNAAIVNYEATLDGAQEVPAVTTTAKGTALLSFDDATMKLVGKLEFSGVTATMAHIHKGATGVVTASPEKSLTATSPIMVDVTLDVAQATALAADGLYFNIHSAANPGGELRGQIKKGGAGFDAGAPPVAGTDSGVTTGATDSGTGTGGSDSGASTTKADGGTKVTPAADDGGCAVTSTRTSNGGFAFALGAGVAIAAVLRSRKKR